MDESSMTHAPRAGVTCQTCHRGATRPPLPLDVELTRAAEAGGGAAAVARYRELRRDHEADGQYDFRLLAVGSAAMRLAESGRMDDALTIARLAKEENPRIADASALIGDLLLRKGDRASAAAAFRDALALDPQNGMARRGLKQAEEAPPPTVTPRN